MTKIPDWIAVDWGTTHLRAWLMTQAGDMIERRNSDQGMGGLARDQFAPILTELLSDVISDVPLPVIICGMAGSRQGWAEAPYVAVPCAPPGGNLATPVVADPLSVRILPGVKQVKPADVMRGEETQIAGFLASDPDFDGILCLPGTHNKWVHISAGEIVSFRTFMTGELFALLADQSVLRHSVDTRDWDEDAFRDALSDTLSRPADLAAKLFSLRAEGLLNDLSAAAARARLSALLIGAELAAAKPYWLGQQVVILGEGSVARAYEAALNLQGAMVRCVDAENMTLAGLTAAYMQWKEPKA
ncbi:2-dehydro-3-deoxygalactonokinase [Aliiroseovarius halocynthiae]|uniref:2-dehydro-3-deoxygalactonokinase n=1 Tax=Aliiroseovarius halocynthiae TaxID=985055 RepID=A0A545SU47_9RHOB|nr:2-dehydro-3-deoxygalactonokinase [Aliiroseovarius halocynthiae]TQV68491.1 2-dehydro-3-deoxygalactonokinase [Aliiroseovarius halocynthiae]SMR70888.1 2-dehydro-3-deoxygalactonokinase [Aliiroseovarius halocynthiae]